MRVYAYILLLILGLTSCKSEYERIRTSNNPKKIYQKALSYFDAKDYGKAQSLLELSIPNYRGKEEAEDLFYKYAYTHYYLGEYILAAHYFNSFATTFYNSDKREEATFMSAYSNYKLSPNAKLDQTYTQKAIGEFQSFVNTFPRSVRVEESNALIDEMREKLETKAYLQGELYYNLGQYQAALQSFENLLKDFPDTANDSKIKYLMIKSSYELADRSIYSKKLDRFQHTLDLYNKYNEQLQRSGYIKELRGIQKYAQKEVKKLKA